MGQCQSLTALFKRASTKNLTKKKTPHHEDLSKKKMIRDEKNVRCVLVCVKSFVPELYLDDQPLMHLASGEIASKNMVIEFKTAKKLGEDFEKNSSVDLLV